MDCVLDIVRESSGLLCSNLPMLLLITLVLIFPVSSITLSQAMTTSHLAGQLSAYLSRHLAHAGIHLTPITSLFYTQLSETMVFQALCFPVILTLFLFAKVAIFYILSCQQRGREASVMGFLEEGPRAWIRVGATYLWGCALVLLMTGIVLLLNIAWSRISNLMVLDSSDRWICLALELVSAVAFMLMLAPLVIAMNLGSVVAGMERRSGGRAFLRALALLKHQKLQPALLLFLVTGIGITAMECTFHYRVLGRGSAGADAAAPSWSFLEAPFLVFGHSFLLLFDIVMSFAFYHACESGATVAAYACRTGKQDGDEEEDHFSICVHIVEQHCRKIFYPKFTTATVLI